MRAGNIALRMWLLLLAAGTLMACAKPIDAEHMAYVGYWRGETMSLSISADGRVNYARKHGSGHTTINAPLVKFVGNDFVVGVGPMTTTFVVSDPPRLVEGVWRMTVDGEALTRSGAAIAPPSSVQYRR